MRFRLPFRRPPEVATRQYRIICVVRRDDGRLKAMGYSISGNPMIYDGIWTIEQARQAIFRGYRLYTVGRTGGEADLEYAEGRIRTKPSQRAHAVFEDLPDCSRR